MMRRTPHAVVVGAGMGGLSAALGLARAGMSVTLLERAKATGGKVAVEEVAGRAFDVGPTVLTMRWVFDDLFAQLGRRLEDHVTLEPCSRLARHAWSDGTRLDLYAEPAETQRAIGEAFGPRHAQEFARFANAARSIYEVVREPFILRQRPGARDLLREAARLRTTMLRIDGLRTMWRALEGHFTEPKLRQLFGRYATYCGGSPFEAPATLNLIAHVEALGVHRVAGGMVQLARALEELARQMGVDVRTGVDVERVVLHEDRVVGVALEGGVSIGCDVVVFNGDVSAVGTLVEPSSAPRPLEQDERSFSAVTFAIVGRAERFPLVHHNVFFSDDYERELRELARGQVVGPTVYVCAQDRRDEPATHTEERLFLVLNAPPTGDDGRTWSEQERQRWQAAAFSTMQACGLDVKTTAARIMTPVDWAKRFPRTGGALYGPKPRGALSALSREGARTKVTGLYLAGGSVHPGPGIPMAAWSGQLAAQAVIEDLVSTERFRPADTNGITSTG